MPTQEEIDKMSPEEIARLQKENCIFCKIIKGEIPSKKVYEDDTTVAILDINPARKGHLLVMPKEHYPILPLVPPDMFKKIFEATKIISAGVKKAMLVPKTTIFLANGAVAGQQSPHFLFHIIPREQGDGLTNFDLSPNPAVLADNDALFEPLKNNLSIMMAKFTSQIGKPASPAQQAPSSPSSVSAPSQEQLHEKREKIAKILEENEEVRHLIMNDPEQFKIVVSTNAQLTELFTGVDLTALANNLKQLESNADIQQAEKEFKEQQEKKQENPAPSPPQPQPTKPATLDPLPPSFTKDTSSSAPTPSPTPTPQPDAQASPTPPHPASAPQPAPVSQPAPRSSPSSSPSGSSGVSSSVADYAKNLQPKKSAPTPSPTPASKPADSTAESPSTAHAPVDFSKVFLGDNPQEQKNKIFAYFEQKPRAKELLMEDALEFMNLLQQRDDVKPLFANVDINLLSKKLNEQKDAGGEQ